MRWKRGFRRVFIVLAILYLIPIVGLIVMLMPTAADYQSVRVFNSVNLIKRYDPQVFSESEWTDEITDKVIEQGANQWLEAVHQKYQGQIDFRQIEEEYKENMQNLSLEQAKGLLSGLLVWIVPLGVVYLLGLLVAWIVTGFRESTKKVS